MIYLTYCQKESCAVFVVAVAPTRVYAATTTTTITTTTMAARAPAKTATTTTSRVALLCYCCCCYISSLSMSMDIIVQLKAPTQQRVVGSVVFSRMLLPVPLPMLCVCVLLAVLFMLRCVFCSASFGLNLTTSDPATNSVCTINNNNVVLVISLGVDCFGALDFCVFYYFTLVQLCLS